MEIAGMAMAIVGYALFYSGASNLFTGGNGWGFLQSLLNKGESNASGGFASGNANIPGNTGSGKILGKGDTNSAGGVLGGGISSNG